jgi:hypothetical protein
MAVCTSFARRARAWAVWHTEVGYIVGYSAYLTVRFQRDRLGHGCALTVTACLWWRNRAQLERRHAGRYSDLAERDASRGAKLQGATAHRGHPIIASARAQRAGQCQTARGIATAARSTVRKR